MHAADFNVFNVENLTDPTHPCLHSREQGQAQVESEGIKLSRHAIKRRSQEKCVFLISPLSVGCLIMPLWSTPTFTVIDACVLIKAVTRLEIPLGGHAVNVSALHATHLCQSRDLVREEICLVLACMRGSNGSTNRHSPHSLPWQVQPRRIDHSMCAGLIMSVAS